MTIRTDKRLFSYIGLFRIAALLPVILLGMTACVSVDPSSVAESAAQTESAAAVYHKLSQTDAKAIMDSGEPYTLVDVRTQLEYDGGHIRGAILIPVSEIGDKAPGELPDKNALIMVYCRTGVRSKSAAVTLLSLGYTNVWDIGGITTWPYDTDIQ